VSPPDPPAPAIPQSFRPQIRRNPIGNLDLAAALLANFDALVCPPAHRKPLRNFGTCRTVTRIDWRLDSLESPPID
jgi:hypothetical protein